MAVILSGKELSEKLTQEQKQRVAELKAQGIHPGLAVVLVGEDPASTIYVRNKGIACETIGIHSETIRLPEDASQEQLEDTIQRLNEDKKISGILVQLPLPKHLDEEAALAKILPEKDVDGFHLMNAGKLFTGQEGVIPCTPKGILYMLKEAGIELKGKEAVIIGRSNIVGKPAAMLLLQEHCTVTICHSRTQNLKEHARRADILVAAIGKPRFVTADMVKPGAAVMDVGINRVDGKVVGDVDYEPVSQVAGYITPVPGGIGKMTISMLMENTLEAACRQGR
jgi:methylenetetrahydrofolate dehydrogenase (NADP+)/methenyltetrahydrofolate cyclohydrolase